MTPKEKAKELFEKFKPYSINNTPDYEMYNSAEIAFQMAKSSGKQCALIAVDLIIKEGLENMVNDFYSDQGYYIDNITSHVFGYTSYWQEVKIEIKKL